MELLPHLESTCTRCNASARGRTRSSAGPERSQQLQILQSLTVRQIFSVSAYFSCCANTGGPLVFSRRQCFCRCQYFCIRQGFVGANIFVSAKVLDALMFLYLPRFLDAPMFLYPPRFLDAPMFCIHQRFLDVPMFLYIFSAAYNFVYFTRILI
jgi:hypothetical protein